MDIGIDRVRQRYAVGILFGVIATFYFAFRMLEDPSPTITAILLFLDFLLFAAAGLAVVRPLLDTVFYAIAAAAYFIDIAYSITRFDLGDASIFLLLAGSSDLFIAMGSLSSEGMFDLDRRRATIAMGVLLLLLGIALVGVANSLSVRTCSSTSTNYAVRSRPAIRSLSRSDRTARPSMGRSGSSWSRSPRTADPTVVSESIGVVSLPLERARRIASARSTRISRPPGVGTGIISALDREYLRKVCGQKVEYSIQ